MSTPIASGAFASVTVPAGQTLQTTGTGMAVYGTGPLQGQPASLSGSNALGPFERDQQISLTATGQGLAYDLLPPPFPPEYPADSMTSAEVAAVRGMAAAPLAFGSLSDVTASPPTPTFSASFTDTNYRRLSMEDFRPSVQLVWNSGFGWFDPPNAGPIVVETILTGDELVLLYRCAEATQDVFDVWVNDKRITAAPFKSSSTTVANSFYYMTIPFGSVAVRKIRLKMARVSALNVWVKNTASARTLTQTRRRVAYVSDSFGDKAGDMTTCLSTMPSLAAELLGADILAASVGGSGYVAGTPFDNAGRLAGVAAFAPDVLVFWSGINDTFNAGTYQARVLSTLQAYKAACPSASIVTVACVPTDATSTLSTNRRDCALAIAAATAAVGGVCIDGVGFVEANGLPAAWNIGTSYTVGQFSTRRGAIFRCVIPGSGQYTEPGRSANWVALGYPLTGTGRAGATTGDGSRDILLSNDNVHPTDAWAYELAVRNALDLRTRLLG